MDRHEFVELAHAVIKLGTSERTIRRRIEEGDLFARKVGKKWYVQIPIDTQVQAGALSGILPESPALNFVPDAVVSPAPIISPTTFAAPASATRQMGNLEGQVDSQSKYDSQTNQKFPTNRSQGFKRPRDSNRSEHEPDPNDRLDKHFSVGRLAAWSKVRLLQEILTDSLDQADRNEAAAALLEGYLGYGDQKIESYRLCRSILCRLATRIASRGDADLLESVTDALGASHALVITLNRRNERQAGRASH
jgi:hypothetical protein